MDKSAEETITACADKAAIENILGLYCRAIDRLDVNLLKSIYHPEAIDDHGAMCVNAHEFAEQITTMLKDACIYTMHTVTHSVIDIQGDDAVSESYYLAIHTVPADEAAIKHFLGETYFEAERAAGRHNRRHEYVCCGRYLDKLQKRDGEWKILNRKITNEWGACRPESMVSDGMASEFATASHRDRRDPVYSVLFQ